MTLAALIIVQALHVLAAIVFFGGFIYSAVIIWPDLLRRPPIEAKAALAAFEKPMGILMASAGHTLIWLGLLRGTYLGPIQSLDVLLHTGYGHTFLTALVLTVGFMAHSGMMRARIPQRVWDGDRLRPEAARYITRYHTIALIWLLLILLCMIAMRFGL
jgi:putative copper export protein